MLGQKRNERRLRQHLEAAGRDRGQHGGLFVEDEKRAFTRARSLHDGGEHAAGGLTEVALRRQLGPQLGESFYGAQQPAEMVSLNGHDERKRETLSKLSVARGNTAREIPLLVSLVLARLGRPDLSRWTS